MTLNKMKSLFVVVNTPELPTPYTHHKTTFKFATGFEQNGYEVIEAKTNDTINLIPDTEQTIFMVSNHGIEGNWNADKLNIFSRFQRATVLLWHYHQFIIRKGTSAIPIKNWLLTGEHMRYAPKLPSHMPSWKLNQELGDKFIPLTFCTSLHPDKIGTLPRQEKYLAQFVGSPYKTEWSLRLPNSFIRTTALSVSEEERIESFLSSKFALGFHSPENIQNHVVVERVPEALAYGAVCLTDNPEASLVTEGLATWVETYEELVEQIEGFTRDKVFYESYQRDGYEWAKQHGTYFTLAKKFMERIENNRK